MPLEFTPGDPITLMPEWRIRLMLYGMPGATKTRTAATATYDERSAPVLILNASANPISIRDYVPFPSIIDVRELEDLNDPYDWIMRDQPKDDPLVERFELVPPYRTLIVDQITELQRMYFDKVMAINTLKPADIPVKRTYNLFGRVLQGMMLVSRLYLDPTIPMHVIFVAQEREANSEEGRLMGPLLEGQSQVEVPSYCNIICRVQHYSQVDKVILRVMEKDYPDASSIAFFEPTGKFQAKDQFGRLPSYMPDPTFTKMLDLIYSE